MYFLWLLPGNQGNACWEMTLTLLWRLNKALNDWNEIKKPWKTQQLITEQNIPTGIWKLGMYTNFCFLGKKILSGFCMVGHCCISLMTSVVHDDDLNPEFITPSGPLPLIFSAVLSSCNLAYLNLFSPPLFHPWRGFDKEDWSTEGPKASLRSCVKS